MNWNRKDKKTWVEDPITGEVFPFPVEDTNESDRYWSVKTRYPKFDALFKGFRSGNLVGIGGKSAAGKSALALNLALNMAEHGTKVCLFSFELSYEDVVARLLARKTGIELSTILSRNLTQDQNEIVEEALDYLDSIPLELHAPSSVAMDAITVEAIRETVRNPLHECDQGILIIDCLDLIQSSKNCDCNDSSVEGLDSIVLSLKRLAMQLRVPVIVTTHLDRTEGRGDICPLSEHADIMMFLDQSSAGEGSDGHWIPMDIHVAKFRQGPTDGLLQLAFIPELMWFTQFEEGLPTKSEETVAPQLSIKQTTPPWVRPQDSE